MQFDINTKVYIWAVRDGIDVLDSVLGLEKYVQAFIVDDNRITEHSTLGHRNYIISEADWLVEHIDNLPLVVFDESEALYIKRIDRKSLLKEPYVLTFEEWFSKIVSNEDVVIRPSKVGIDASTLCNINCSGCYMRINNYDGVGAGTLAFDKYKEFLEQHSFVKEIELSNNGEAFLNPQIIDILELSQQKNVNITFYSGTNFNHVTDDVLGALVNNSVKGITIAIDGASQEIYEKYRRGGDYKKVIHNIEKLKLLKEKKKRKHPKLYWQYVLMKENECDIEKAKRQAKELGMEIIYKLDWSGKYVAQNEDFVRQVTGLKYFNRKDANYDWSRRCRELIFLPRINWNGKLLGCCSSHSMDFDINIFDIGLETALNSIKYKKAICDVFSRHRPEKDVPCGNCWIYNKHII